MAALVPKVVAALDAVPSAGVSNGAAEPVDFAKLASSKPATPTTDAAKTSEDKDAMENVDYNVVDESDANATLTLNASELK